MFFSQKTIKYNDIVRNLNSQIGEYSFDEIQKGLETFKQDKELAVKVLLKLTSFFKLDSLKTLVFRLILNKRVLYSESPISLSNLLLYVNKKQKKSTLAKLFLNLQKNNKPNSVIVDQALLEKLESDNNFCKKN